MKIDKSVVEVLKTSEFDGSLLRLPGQLERKLYEHVAKVLRNIGGKWSSAKKAFGERSARSRGNLSLPRRIEKR